MPRTKIGYLIISSGVILAVVPLVAWYILPGPVTMAGDIVLENGTRHQIFESGLGRLILCASFTTIIFAIVVASICEKLKTKPPKSES